MPSSTTRILRTKYLFLRPVLEGDFEAFYQTLLLDPYALVSWPAYPESLTDKQRRDRAWHDFFQPPALDDDAGVYPSWTVTPRGEPVGTPDKFIGWCGLLPSTLRDGALGPQLVYMLGSWYHGQGLMPEAVRGVVKDTFRHFRWQAIHVLTDAANSPAQRVAEEVGFSYQGDMSGDIACYTLERSAFAGG